MHHTARTRRHVGARAPHALGMLVAAALGSTPAFSLTRDDNVSFNAVNRNPWVAGEAFSRGWTNKDISASLAVPVPNVSLSPAAALANFLGLPEIGFARLGGEMSGQFGLDLGYFVDGGRLNVKYPGTGRIEIETRAGNIVPTFLTTTTKTAFLPGLYREFQPLQTDVMVARGGAGYDPALSIPEFGLAKYKEPTFQTSFPNAAAWAELHWDARASLKAEAGLLRLRNPITGDVECIACVDKRFSLSSKDRVTLLDVNRSGVEVIGLGRQALFDQTIALGAGSVRVSYPDVAVGGGRVGSGTQLAGSAAKPILTFNGDLEKLVPVVGAFLRQSAGPFEVKLVGASGGPVLSLYQDFTIDVAPRVELNFSRPVEWLRPGGSELTQRIDVALGESLQWRPIPGGGSGKLLVQPRYILDGNVHNRTGFAVGYKMDIDALEVDAGFGALGPLDVVKLENNAAIKLPAFYDETFSLGLGSVTAVASELEVRAPFITGPGEASLELLSWKRLDGAAGAPGNFQFNFASGANSFQGTAFGALRETIVGGREQTFFETEFDMRFGVGDGSVIGVGRLLCLVCVDTSAQLQGSDPFFVDGADTLYFNPLFDFRKDEIDAGAPRLNGAATAISALVAPTLVIDATRSVGDHAWAPTVAVPEPGTWAQLGLGLALIGTAAARRTLRRP